MNINRLNEIYKINKMTLSKPNNPNSDVVDKALEKSGLNHPFLNVTKHKPEYDLTDDGTGKKYDSGKPMIGTAFNIFAKALLGVGACIEFGTHKYPDPANWKKIEGGEKRYLDSLCRHLAKHCAGQVYDSETGLPHLFHCCWNMLAITEHYLIKHPDIEKKFLEL